MVASTRRTLMCAILAAPAVAVPVATAHALRLLEAQFLALSPRLITLCDQYDVARPAWEEPYEAWAVEREQGLRLWRAEDEELPSYKRYLEARKPADDVEQEVLTLYQPFEGVRFTSFEAILLRHRIAMTMDWICDEAREDMDALCRTLSVP